MSWRDWKPWCWRFVPDADGRGGRSVLSVGLPNRRPLVRMEVRLSERTGPDELRVVLDGEEVLKVQQSGSARMVTLGQRAFCGWVGGDNSCSVTVSQVVVRPKAFSFRMDASDIPEA